MITKLRSLALLTLFTLGLTPLASSLLQAQQESMDFFAPDFVTGPKKGAENEANRPAIEATTPKDTSARPRSPGQVVPGKSGNPDQDIFFSPEEDPTPTPQPLVGGSMLDQAQERGSKIRFISLITRAEPRQHLINNLNQFQDLLTKQPKILVGEVFFVASPHELSLQERQQLAPLLANFPPTTVLELPKQIGIKAQRSPTWILETDDGRVVLEGVEKLESFVNSAGEFVAGAVRAE